MSIARLGDGAASVMAGAAGGKLAGHRAAVAHELARMSKPRKLPDLGDHAGGGHPADTAQALQGGHHGTNRLRGLVDRLIDRRIQTLDALFAVNQLVQILTEHDTERRLVERESLQPGAMRGAPCLDALRWPLPMAQQKL